MESEELLIKNHKLLRDYQKKGVDFFVNNDSCLLADEMGLGKTVQTSVALDVLFHDKKINKVLIICPAALVFNWYKELSKWCPSVSRVIISGTQEKRESLYLLPYNIWISSFEQVRIDMEMFISEDIGFDIVILDEAQRIKNKNSKTSLACKLIQRKKSWALTGTPIENNIADIISIYSFVKEGTINDFDTNDDVKYLIEDSFLRRTKSEVLKDLPPILYNDIYLKMNRIQLDYYEDALNEYVSSDEKMASIFARISKLKTICNFIPNSDESIKYDALLNILENAKYENQKVLIFSQYVETLNRIKRLLKIDLNNQFNIFHGGLNKEDRDVMINNFEKNKKFDILLISLKAGGVGLNLNSATNVVLFDRWWNPALENQAIHRAHRFGKKFPLNVYRFIISDTIEEKIENILKKKELLFDEMMNDSSITEHNNLFTKEDLLMILQRE